MIASTTPEGKDSTTGRLLAQMILGEGRQPLDPLPHVGYAAGQIDSDACAGPNHTVSSTRLCCANPVTAAPSLSLDRPILRAA